VEVKSRQSSAGKGLPDSIDQIVKKWKLQPQNEIELSFDAACSRPFAETAGALPRRYITKANTGRSLAVATGDLPAEDRNAVRHAGASVAVATGDLAAEQDGAFRATAEGVTVATGDLPAEHSDLIFVGDRNDVVTTGDSPTQHSDAVLYPTALAATQSTALEATLQKRQQRQSLCLWGEDGERLGRYVRQKLEKNAQSSSPLRRESLMQQLAHEITQHSSAFSPAELGAVTGALRTAYAAMGDSMTGTLMLMSTLAALKLPVMSDAEVVGIASNLGFFAGAFIQKRIMKESVVSLFPLPLISNNTRQTRVLLQSGRADADVHARDSSDEGQRLFRSGSRRSAC
jgi:hypothetical protein